MELTIPCDRCLEEVKVPVAIHIEREAELSDGVLVPDPDEETDTFLQGEQLDVDRLIDDEILVNWPTKVPVQGRLQGDLPEVWSEFKPAGLRMRPSGPGSENGKVPGCL